jgi:hypothetical protein
MASLMEHYQLITWQIYPEKNTDITVKIRFAGKAFTTQGNGAKSKSQSHGNRGRQRAKTFRGNSLKSRNTSQRRYATSTSCHVVTCRNSTANVSRNHTRRYDIEDVAANDVIVSSTDVCSTQSNVCSALLSTVRRDDDVNNDITDASLVSSSHTSDTGSQDAPVTDQDSRRCQPSADKTRVNRTLDSDSAFVSCLLEDTLRRRQTLDSQIPTGPDAVPERSGFCYFCWFYGRGAGECLEHG